MVEIKIVSDIAECKKLWEKFSSGKSLWEQWDLLLAFYKHKEFKPYFIVIKEGAKEVGILPLANEKGTYYFFGGSYPEDRKLWFDEKYTPLVFDALPSNTKLFDINHESTEKIIAMFPEYKEKFTEIDYNYFLDLNQLKDIDSYIKTFTKKHRKNFLYDLKKVKEKGYGIRWEKKESFMKIVEFNIARFGEESDMLDHEEVAELSDFMDYLDKKKILFTAAVVIEGEVQGAEIAAFFNGIYYVINGGYNPGIKNLGKFLIFAHIQKAFELGADKIDFLVGDTGWKELWNFEKEKCYTYIKK